MIKLSWYSGIEATLFCWQSLQAMAPKQIKSRQQSAVSSGFRQLQGPLGYQFSETARLPCPQMSLVSLPKSTRSI